MTQLEEAVGGTDEPIIAAEPTIEDRFAAVIDDEQPEEASQEAPEGEEPELDESDLEDEAPEPIKPPVSWPDEKKALFADLPREVQEVIAERETDRERFIQSKSREAKQAQAEAETKALQHIQDARALHMQQLQALLPTIPQKPSAHLQYEDPQQYAYELDLHDATVAQHNWIVQQMDAIGQQHQLAQTTMRAQQEAQSLEVLREALPEYFDQEKGAELRQALRSTALELGYSEEMIANVDASDVLALKRVSDMKAKADKYDALMSKRMEKVREAKKLPAVSKPGVARGKGTLANESYTRDRLAMRDGDRDAATRVFSRFL